MFARVRRYVDHERLERDDRLRSRALIAQTACLCEPTIDLLPRHAFFESHQRERFPSDFLGVGW